MGNIVTVASFPKVGCLNILTHIMSLGNVFGIVVVEITESISSRGKQMNRGIHLTEVTIRSRIFKYHPSPWKEHL